MFLEHLFPDGLGYIETITPVLGIVLLCPGLYTRPFYFLSYRVLGESAATSRLWRCNPVGILEFFFHALTSWVAEE